MLNMKLLTISSATLLLAACSTAPTVPNPAQALHPQVLLCPESLNAYATPCGEQPPTDPDPTTTPNSFVVHSLTELYSQAEALGLSPAEAGVPNAASLSAQRLQAQGLYPTDSVGTGAAGAVDFVNKLFSRGTAVTPSTVPIRGASTSDATCTTTVVDVNAPVDFQMSSNGNDPSLYTGSMLQGAYVNAGVGSMRRIYPPNGKAANLTLSTSFPGPRADNIAPYLADVNAGVGQLINASTAPDDLGGNIFFDAREASSVQEANLKYNIKGSFGAIQAGLDSDSTSNRSRSTIVVMFYQSSYWVDVSLPNRPVVSLFNNVTKEDLEGLGQDDQLAYDNLPMYVSRTTYGRMFMFSMSSNASTDELKIIANAAWGPKDAGSSAGLTTHQKNVLQQSTIHVSSYGGTFTPVASAIKDGSYKSFFTGKADPKSMLPTSYSISRLDANGGAVRVFNPLHYTERRCNPYKKVSLKLSNIIGTAKVSVKVPSKNYADWVFSATGDQEFDLTDSLEDGNNELIIESSPNSNWSNQRRVRAEVFIDDASRDTEDIACRRTHTNDMYLATINKNTGVITRHVLPNGTCP